MSENNVWESSNTPLYEKGDLVVYHGYVLKCKGTYAPVTMAPPHFDCGTHYAPGDFCKFAGKVYMRTGVDPRYRGPFRQEHWTEPPICHSVGNE